MAGMTLRQLSPDDPELNDILTLIRGEFSYMDGRIDPPSSVHRLNQTTIQRQARDHETWAIGHPPIACVFLTMHPDHLYLGKLAVAKAQRGQGHARALIDLALKRARDLGLATLQLETRIELVENQATFRSLGFKKIAETAHPGYSHPTSITYSKDVI